jgi:hypothetical protein
MLTGGCALSCIELDHATGRVGINFINQPIIGDELRTGHKNCGFVFKVY